MMKHLLIGLAIAITAASGIATADQAAKESAALTAAETWLILVDEEHYRDSWDSAAGYFKTTVNEGQWLQVMHQARSQLGKRLSRNLQSKHYRTSLPGAPDGEYVVLTFHTTFENKKSATETVTPMLDPDGKWRVSGYYIK